MMMMNDGGDNGDDDAEMIMVMIKHKFFADCHDHYCNDDAWDCDQDENKRMRSWSHNHGQHSQIPATGVYQDESKDVKQG